MARGFGTGTDGPKALQFLELNHQTQHFWVEKTPKLDVEPSVGTLLVRPASMLPNTRFELESRVFKKVGLSVSELLPLDTSISRGLRLQTVDGSIRIMVASILVSVILPSLCPHLPTWIFPM